MLKWSNSSHQEKLVKTKLQIEASVWRGGHLSASQVLITREELSRKQKLFFKESGPFNANLQR